MCDIPFSYWAKIWTSTKAAGQSERPTLLYCLLATRTGQNIAITTASFFLRYSVCYRVYPYVDVEVDAWALVEVDANVEVDVEAETEAEAEVEMELLLVSLLLLSYFYYMSSSNFSNPRTMTNGLKNVL